MEVTIDGVPFVPACASASRIGIAITTHNRPEVIKRSIEHHQKHLPAGALVIVVDDASKPAAVAALKTTRFCVMPRALAPKCLRKK